MGWFSSNRRPFSREHARRLDRLESAVESLLAADAGSPVPPPELIPVRVTATRTQGGVEEVAWREESSDPPGPNPGGRSSDGYAADGAADQFAFAARRMPSDRAIVVRHWLASSQDGLPIHDVRHSIVGGSTAGFWASIDGASQRTAGVASWKYSWRERQLANDDSWQLPASGGRSGTTSTNYAINVLEAGNVGTKGYGIDLVSACGRLWVHHTDLDFEFKPVPAGIVVWMQSVGRPDGSTAYVFQAPNPIDGRCDNPDGECAP